MFRALRLRIWWSFIFCGDSGFVGLYELENLLTVVRVGVFVWLLLAFRVSLGGQKRVQHLDLQLKVV